MKIAIFGGSIAGLAAAGRLEQQGHDVSLWEKNSTPSGGGFGILLPSSALGAFDALALGDAVRQAGHPIERCDLRAGEEGSFHQQALTDTHAISRSSLIGILRSSLEKTTFHGDATFVDFDFDGTGRARHGLLSDGRKVEADLFIGADGVRSTVRERVLPGLPLSEVRVVEMVGSIDGAKIPPFLTNTFSKTLFHHQGLAIGLLPVSDDCLVWFIQADPLRNPEIFSQGRALQNWVGSVARRCPSPVRELCLEIDPLGSRLCRSTDRELPSQFHRENVLLLGDAAHPLLPFTSQGTGSAIEDARDLSRLLERLPNNLEHNLQQLARQRLPILRERLRVGRRLQRQFLAPGGSERHGPVPLAS